MLTSCNRTDAPTRMPCPGELVAVKRQARPAGGKAAGGLAHALADAAGTAAAGAEGADGGGTAGGPAAGGLVYGRVAVDAAPSPGQAAYRLSVEVSPGVYDRLLSTHVRRAGCAGGSTCIRSVDTSLSALPLTHTHMHAHAHARILPSFAPHTAGV